MQESYFVKLICNKYTYALCVRLSPYAFFSCVSIYFNAKVMSKFVYLRQNFSYNFRNVFVSEKWAEN